MADYREMYLQLAGKVSEAVDILVEALKQCEEQYISEEEEQDKEE